MLRDEIRMPRARIKAQLGRAIRRALRAIEQGASYQEAGRDAALSHVFPKARRVRLPRSDRRAGQAARLLQAHAGGIDRGVYDREIGEIGAMRMGVVREYVQSRAELGEYGALS